MNYPLSHTVNIEKWIDPLRETVIVDTLMKVQPLSNIISLWVRNRAAQMNSLCVIIEIENVFHT